MNGVLLPNNIQNFRQFENNKLEYLNNEKSTFNNAQGFEFFSSESSATDFSKVTISDGFKEGDIINIKIITSLPNDINKGKGYTSDDKTNLYYKFESLVVKRFLATNYLRDVKEDKIFVDFVELTNELNWIIKIYDSNEKIFNTVKTLFTDKTLNTFFPMIADKKCPLPIGGLDLTIKDFNLVCQRLLVNFIACKIDFTTPNVLTAKTQLDEKIEGADKALELLKKQLFEPFESFTNPAGSGKEKFGETDENCLPVIGKGFPSGIADERINRYITAGFAAGLASGVAVQQVDIQGEAEISTAFNLYSEWLTKIKEWIAEPDQFNIYANIKEPNKKRAKEDAALLVRKIIDSPPTGDLFPRYSKTTSKINGIFALGGCTIKQRFNSFFPNFKNLYDKCIDLYESAVKLNLQQNYAEIKIPLDRAKEYLSKEENTLTEWDNIKKEVFALWLEKGQLYKVDDMYYDMAKAYNYIYEGQSKFFERLRINVRIINGNMGFKDTIYNLTGAPNNKNPSIFANDISTYFRLVKPTTFDEFITKVQKPGGRSETTFRINFWNPNDPSNKNFGTIPVLMEEAYKNAVQNRLIPDDAEKKTAWKEFFNQIYYINRECVRASDRMNDKRPGVKQIEFELIYSMIIAQKTVRECFYNALTGPDGKPNKLYSFVKEEDDTNPDEAHTEVIMKYADITDKLIRLDDENKKYEKDNKNLNLEKIIRKGILNIQKSDSEIINGNLKNRISVNKNKKDGFEAALGVGNMPDRIGLSKVMIAAELRNGEDESINYPFINLVVQPFYAEKKFLEIFKQKHLVDGKLNDNGLYYLDDLDTTSVENMKFFNKIAIALKQAIKSFGKRLEIELYTTPEKRRENKSMFIDDLKTRTEMYTNFEKLEAAEKAAADGAEKDKLKSMKDKINPTTPPVLVVKDLGKIFTELSEEEQDLILQEVPLDINVQPTIREMYDTFQLMEHVNPRGTGLNGGLKGLPKEVLDIYHPLPRTDPTPEGAPNVYKNSTNIFMYYLPPVWSFKRIFDNIENNLRNTIYANIRDNHNLFLNDYYGLERDLTLKSIPEIEKVMIRKLREGEGGGKGGYYKVFEKLNKFIIEYPSDSLCSKDNVIFYRYNDKKSFFDFNNLFNGGKGFFAGNVYTEIREFPGINALKWPEVLEKIQKKCEELETVSTPNDKIAQLRTYLSTDIAKEYSPGETYPFEYHPSQDAVPPQTWAEYIIICQGLVARDSTTSVPVPGNKYLQRLFDSNDALYDAGELLKNEDLKNFPELKYKYESVLKLAISTIASLFDELNKDKVDDINFYYRIANTNDGIIDKDINKQIISAIYSDIEIDSDKLINLKNLYLPDEISSAAFRNAEYIYNILIENGWNTQDPSIPGMDEAKKLLELIKDLSPWDAKGNALDSRMMQFSFPFWGVMPPIENPTDSYLETSFNATVKVIEGNAKHKNLRSTLRQIDRLDKAIGDITSNFISTVTYKQNRKIAETIITLRQFLVESIGVIFPMFKNLFQNTPEDEDYLNTKEFAYIKNGKKTAEKKDIYHFSPSHNNDRPKTFTYKGSGRWPELDGSGDYGDMMNWEEVILQNPIEIPAKSKTIDNLKQYYNDLVNKTKQVSSITGPDLNLVSIYQNVGKFSPNMNIMVSIKLKFNKLADNKVEKIKQLISEPLLSDFKIFQKNVYSSCDLFVTDLKNTNKEDSMLKYDYSLKLVFYEVDNIAVYDGIYNYFNKRHEVILGEIEKEGLQPFYKEFKKKVYNSELILTDGTKFITTTIPIEVNNERFDAIKIINYTSFLNIKIRQFLVEEFEEFKKSVLQLSEQYIQQGILLNNMYKFLGLMPKSIYEELDSVFTKIPNLMDKSFLTDVKPGVKLDESRNNNLFGFNKYLYTDYEMASLLLNFKFLSTGKHITDFQVGPIDGVAVDPLGKTKEVYGVIAGKFNDKDNKGVDVYSPGNKFLINDYAYTLVSLLRLKEIEILYENVEKNIKNYNDFGTNFMANSNNKECYSKSPLDVKINCLENMPNRRMIKNTFVSNIVEILDKIRGIIQIKIPKSKLNFTLDDYKTTVRMDGKTSRTDKMWTSMNDDGEVVLPADAPGGGVGIGGATPIVSDSIAIDRYKYTISFKSKVPYFKDEVNSCNYNGFYEKQSCRAFNNETWVYCGDIPYKKYDDSADDEIITKCNEESENKDICKTFPQRGLDSDQINKLTDEGIFRNFYFGPSPMTKWPSITPEVCSPETEACMNDDSCERIYNYYNSRQPAGESLPPFKKKDENKKAPPGCYAKMKGDNGDEVEEIHYNTILGNDEKRNTDDLHPWSAAARHPSVGKSKILNDPRDEDGMARNWYRQICGCDKINQIEENKNCNDSIPYPTKRMDNLVTDLNNKDVKNILIRKLYNVLAFQKRIVKIFETGESVTGNDALLIKDEFGKFTYDDKKHQIFIDYNVEKITNTDVEVKYIVNQKYINEGNDGDSVEVLDVYSGRQVSVIKENKRLNDIVKTSIENIIVKWDLEFYNYRESEFQILYKYFKDSNNLDILLSEVYNNECLNELLPNENKKNERWPCAILSSNRINTNNNFTPYYVESKEDLNVKQLDLEICHEFNKCDAGTTSHKIDESSQAHKIIEGKGESEKKALCCREKTCKDELKHLSIFKLNKVDCSNDKGYVNVSKNTTFGNGRTESYFNKKTPETDLGEVDDKDKPCARAYVERGPTWKDRPITPECDVLKSCCKPITCKDIEIGTLIPTEEQRVKAGVNNDIILSSCSTAEEWGVVHVPPRPSDGTGYFFNEDKKYSIPVIDSSISDVNERMIDYKNEIQTECCEKYTCDTYITKLKNTCSVFQLPIDNLKEPPVDGITANCCRAKTCRDIKLGNIEGGSDTMCKDLGMKDNLTVDGKVVETPCEQCITTNPHFANITHKNCCKPKTCKDYRDEGAYVCKTRVKSGSDDEENLKKSVDGKIVEITEADKKLFINEKCCERLTCEESLQNIMESDGAFKGKSINTVKISFCNRTDINVKAKNAVFNYVKDPTTVSVKYTGSDTSEYNQIAESCCVEQGKRKCSELQNAFGMCKVEDSNRLDPNKENDEMNMGDELAYYKECCSRLTCLDYKNGFNIKSGIRYEGTFNNVAESGKLENISYVDGSGKTIIDENSKFNPETAGDEVKITELSKCTTAKTCQDYNRNGTVNVCGDNNGLEYNSNNNETIVEANTGCEGKTGEELFACKCCEIKTCGDFKLNNCNNSDKAYIKSQLNVRPENVEDFENQCCRNRTCIEHKDETNFECDDGFTLNTDVKRGVESLAVKEQCCREKVCSKDIICSGKNLNNNDDSIKGTEVNEKNCCTILQCEDNFDCDDDKEKIKYASYNTKVSTTKDEINAKCCKSKLDELVSTKIVVSTTDEVLNKLIERYQSLTVNFNTVTDNFENSFVKLVNSVIPKSGDIDLIKIEQTNVIIKEIKKEDLPADAKILEKYEAVGAKVGENNFAEIDFTVSDLNTESRIFLEGLFTTVLNINTMQKVFDTSFDICCKEYKESNCNEENHPCQLFKGKIEELTLNGKVLEKAKEVPTEPSKKYYNRGVIAGIVSVSSLFLIIVISMVIYLIINRNDFVKFVENLLLKFTN